MMTELRLNVAAILLNVNEPYTLADKKKKKTQTGLQAKSTEGRIIQKGFI